MMIAVELGLWDSISGLLRRSVTANKELMPIAYSHLILSRWQPGIIATTWKHISILAYEMKAGKQRHVPTGRWKGHWESTSENYFGYRRGWVYWFEFHTALAEFRE